MYSLWQITVADIKNFYAIKLYWYHLIAHDVQCNKTNKTYTMCFTGSFHVSFSIYIRCSINMLHIYFIIRSNQKSFICFCSIFVFKRFRLPPYILPMKQNHLPLLSRSDLIVFQYWLYTTLILWIMVNISNNFFYYYRRNAK